MPINFFVYISLRIFFVALLCLPASLYGQLLTLKGKVMEPGDNRLPLANVSILPDSIVVPTNDEGEFQVQIEAGRKNLYASYIGYQSEKVNLVVKNDTTITISLLPKIDQLDELVFTSFLKEEEKIINSHLTGRVTLKKKDIEDIPLLVGEPDVIKTIQLLPGTVKGVEGSSDVFVRGGAADQNLVLLDGATIYNTSHLFGFLSVFNSSILKDVESINGGFPANYGGRLSSILNITSHNEVAKTTKLSGDIGIISSRIYFQQPLIEDKASFWIAGRRSYIDQLVKLVDNEVPYFFHDLNGKLILKPGKKDQVNISFYNGKDVFDLIHRDKDKSIRFTSAYESKNSTQAVQWNHRQPGQWISKINLNRTTFNYDIRNTFKENILNASSLIEDLGMSFSFESDTVGARNKLKAGIDWTTHILSPSLVKANGVFDKALDGANGNGIISHESAAFFQYDWHLSDRVLISSGFRGSFALLSDTSYFVPEPRLSLRIAVSDNQSVKMSYSRMAQYIHRVSNSAIASPTDIWYPVTRKVAPQRSHQVAMAWQQIIPKIDGLFTAEAYYKSMENLIGFEEGTNLFFNTAFEAGLIQGIGRAYGLELLLRKESGRLSGWLSYSLSWSERKFDELNGDEWFYSRYDRRHNGALVGRYKLGKRWEFSAVWEFISGSRFTPVVGQFVAPLPTLAGLDRVPVFTEINAVKLSDTHRLDLGLKYKSRPDRRFQWHIFMGVNNVYNRASSMGIFIEQNEKDGSLKYIQPGLFGFLPFVNWGFNL